ncbi:MAG TPA: peptidoglycan-binding domain-containing protein [Thermoleophilaceae bacterium]
MRKAPLGRAWLACALTALMGLALAPAAFARFGDSTLRKGSRGHDVKVLQSWLTHLGYRTSIDGVFGPGTLRSVRRFERHENLTVDGIVDPPEEALLRKRMQALASNPTQPSDPVPGEKAVISSDGHTAQAPADAPVEVQEVISAANEITHDPYRYGGGHGSFNDTAFDCSGAVSHALHGADLVTRPLDSSDFESWGSGGRGKWITVYANSGHAYMVVAGLRFDTSGSGESGPRWRTTRASTSGYVVRHPAGL